MACRRRDSTARAARDCHPWAGWAQPHRHGPRPPQQLQKRGLPRGRDETSVLDTGGTGQDARSVIIFMLSAQLAQCAACLKLTALRRPNPPAARGRDTVSREDQCTVVESTPTREQKHSQIWLSWSGERVGQVRADGPQEKVGSRNTAVQQEDPRTLQILNGRDSP